MHVGRENLADRQHPLEFFTKHEERFRSPVIDFIDHFFGPLQNSARGAFALERFNGRGRQLRIEVPVTPLDFQT